MVGVGVLTDGLLEINETIALQVRESTGKDPKVLYHNVSYAINQPAVKGKIIQTTVGGMMIGIDFTKPIKEAFMGKKKRYSKKKRRR